MLQKNSGKHNFKLLSILHVLCTKSEYYKNNTSFCTPILYQCQKYFIYLFQLFSNYIWLPEKFLVNTNFCKTFSLLGLHLKSMIPTKQWKNPKTNMTFWEFNQICQKCSITHFATLVLWQVKISFKLLSIVIEMRFLLLKDS